MLVVAPVTFLAQGQYTTPNQTSSPKPLPIFDVTIQDFFFSPTPVTINVGDTVRWTNNGPSPHSSTSDTSVWDSGVLNVGQTFSFTFNTAGTYLYHCSVHPSMHGSVVVNGANNPPDTPSEPSGPTTRVVGQSGIYSSLTTDPDGDQVQYRFDWDATGAHDISAWSVLVPSGQTVNMSHAWSSAGTYVVEAQAMDSVGAMSEWSTGLTITVSESGNNPPTTPTITGPSTGTKGVPIDFTATTTDPDGDMIQYYFDFGDGTNSGWLPMVNSGTIVQVNHTFTKGTYTVKAKARDTSLAESAYGSLSIKIPTSVGYIPEMTFLRLFFLKLAQFFPIFEKFIHM